MTELEMRTGKAERVELRTNDKGAAVLTGYALKYNTLSQNLGGFVETIAPGAVDKSLADGLRVLARYNHDDAYLLGTTDGGTLTLESDGTGLRYDVELPDTSAGRDLRALAERGDVHHSSFAFYTLPGGDEWSLTDNEFPLRTLTAIQLVDVAPVNSPAYLDTTSGLRSLAERTGLDVADIARASAAEVRALILGEERNGAQVDNHAPASTLAVARLRLARLVLSVR